MSQDNNLPNKPSTNALGAPRHRILVVDDDLRLRDLLKRYLTQQGFATDTVPDVKRLTVHSRATVTIWSCLMSCFRVKMASPFADAFVRVA